ncbi:MAG: hypothetical protein QME68_07795, partial [Elusimicrobiota bacterium]|nr:hypothetical protein [Elusimicrobiota bacterium]
KHFTGINKENGQEITKTLLYVNGPEISGEIKENGKTISKWNTKINPDGTAERVTEKPMDHEKTTIKLHWLGGPGYKKDTIKSGKHTAHLTSDNWGMTWKGYNPFFSEVKIYESSVHNYPGATLRFGEEFYYKDGRKITVNEWSYVSNPDGSTTLTIKNPLDYKITTLSHTPGRTTYHKEIEQYGILIGKLSSVNGGKSFNGKNPDLDGITLHETMLYSGGPIADFVIKDGNRDIYHYILSLQANCAFSIGHDLEEHTKTISVMPYNGAPAKTIDEWSSGKHTLSLSTDDYINYKGKNPYSKEDVFQKRNHLFDDFAYTKITDYGKLVSETWRTKSNNGIEVLVKDHLNFLDISSAYRYSDAPKEYLKTNHWVYGLIEEKTLNKDKRSYTIFCPQTNEHGTSKLSSPLGYENWIQMKFKDPEKGDITEWTTTKVVTEKNAQVNTVYEQTMVEINKLLPYSSAGLPIIVRTFAGGKLRNEENLCMDKDGTPLRDANGKIIVETENHDAKEKGKKIFFTPHGAGEESGMVWSPDGEVKCNWTVDNSQKERKVTTYFPYSLYTQVEHFKWPGAPSESLDVSVTAFENGRTFNLPLFHRT